MGKSAIMSSREDWTSPFMGDLMSWLGTEVCFDVPGTMSISGACSSVLEAVPGWSPAPSQGMWFVPCHNKNQP